MIARAALMAVALLSATAAQAQSGCTGIAALAANDGRRMAEISIRPGADGRVALFARNRQIALPTADHCSLDLASDGARDLNCFYTATGDRVAQFDQIVAQFGRCLPARLAVDTTAAPLYPGTTTQRLRRMHYQRAVSGGTGEITLSLIEPGDGDDGQTYLSLSFEFDADPN